MTFTLWSRASLLGELELTEDARGRARGRVALIGPFRPTDAGRAVLPLFQEAMNALMAIGPMLERRGITAERLGPELGQAVHEALHNSSEGERVTQTKAALDALDFELHDATGRLIPIKQITIQELPEAKLAAEGTSAARARADALGFPTYMAAVAVADSSSTSGPST